MPTIAKANALDTTWLEYIGGAWCSSGGENDDEKCTELLVGFSLSSTPSCSGEPAPWCNDVDAKSVAITACRPHTNWQHSFLLWNIRYFCVQRFEQYLEAGQPEERHESQRGRRRQRLEEDPATANLMLDKRDGVKNFVSITLVLSKRFDRVHDCASARFMKCSCWSRNFWPSRMDLAFRLCRTIHLNCVLRCHGPEGRGPKCGLNLVDGRCEIAHEKG